ncbi:GNAT family acetyltransferase [Variovorax boronicumulans]|uniref:GNAT family acetyltransferase n=1 Tax=Variovorax boronicumulans TaxID=436515 RepID=UPI001C59479F
MTRIDLYSNDTHRTQVVSLWQQVFGHAGGHNDACVAIDKKVEANDGFFFVALRDGRVIGTTLAGYDGHRGWLYSVAVHPLYRQRGVGSALVAHAEAALTRRGCMKINLQIVSGNESVAAFYEALGFAVEPRVSMGKKVAANIPGA